MAKIAEQETVWHECGKANRLLEYELALAVEHYTYMTYCEIHNIFTDQNTLYCQ